MMFCLQEERDCWVHALCDANGLSTEPPPGPPPPVPDEISNESYEYVDIVAEGPPRRGNGKKEKGLERSGDYQGLQAQDPPTQYREPEAKVQAPVYDAPHPPYAAVRHKSQPCIKEPENEIGIYEEINVPPSPNKIRSRPPSSDFSGFTSDQLTYLINLLEHVGAEGTHIPGPIPVSPRRKPQQLATTVYDDTIVVKNPPRMYENATGDDIYDSIVDDYPLAAEPASPWKPAPPPKPQKNKGKQRTLAPLTPTLPPLPRPISTGEAISKYTDNIFVR